MFIDRPFIHQLFIDLGDHVTFRSGPSRASRASRAARLRTITLAGILGICTAVGPLALSASAAADPALTLSASTVRPGAPFTVSAVTGCPADSGQQSVDFGFTDDDGTYALLGSTETDDNGAWTATSLALPVVGVDAEGNWQGDPLAAGTGTIDATCTAADDGNDFDQSSFRQSQIRQSSTDPVDDDNAGDDEGDDLGDDNGDDVGTVTRTYAAANLTLKGSAPQLSVSPAVARPGDAVTVTPSAACPAASAGTVDVSVIQIGAVGDDEGDDNGDDNGDENNSDDNDFADSSTGSAGAAADATASTTASTTSSGAWSAVSITLPDDADTGDYAVAADCVVAGRVVGSYDAAPIALGTVTLTAPVCSADGATVTLKGSYSGDVTVSTAKRGLAVGAKLALKGSGPWPVKVSSATTGLALARSTVTCPKPAFDLDVPKTSVSGGGKLRANVCNTGKRSVSAVLQVARGGRFKAVDTEKLASGDCSVLTGGKLAKGDSVKARVLLDAPGSSSDEVSASFTARRPRH